jgi:hypothetical protein
VSNVIVGVEKERKAKARCYMVRNFAENRHVAVAELLFRGQLYKSEVPVTRIGFETEAIAAALDDVRQKAKAVALTDFQTGERIR